MKKIVYLLSIIQILFFPNLSGQGVKFTASTKKVVATGEQFKLVYSINAQGKGFRAPDLRNFSILSGPNSSTSTSVQIINGKMTQSITNSYTYYLQATKQGKFAIKPAKITVDGKVHSSNSVSIEVVKGSTAGSTNKKNTNNTKSAGLSSDDLFVRLSLSKSQAYLGEQIIATIKIYSRVDLVDFADMEFPSFDGFWSQEIETPANITLERENVKGKIYNTGLLKKNILFPQQSGEITIDPFELECVVRQRTGKRDFFGRYMTRNVIQKVKSARRKIKVKSLPASKPDGFNGAVGSFKMNASIDKDQVKTNEAITLNIKISGSGNLKLIDPLEIEFPPDFETFDPKINSNIKNSSSGASGVKTFEYLILPRHAGEFSIPPIAFSYFDPASKTFKTLHSDEYKITVEKGKEEETTTIISGTKKENVKFIGNDIRFIKTNNSELREKGKLFFGSAVFFLSYLIAIALFFLVFILFRKKRKQDSDQVLVRNKKAGKVSKKRLRQAALYLKNNEKENFYNEVSKALWGYLSDKLSIPLSELSKENIEEALSKHQVPEELSAQFSEVLDTCEFARYAPVSEASEMSLMYDKASELISKLEQKLR